MSDIGELLKSSTPLGIRVGMVTAVIDATHVAVDIGDRLIGASWPASLGEPVKDVDVTLIIGDGIARVVTSSRAAAQALFGFASGSTSISLSNSGTGSTNVSFPSGRFTVTPRFKAYLRTPDLRVSVSTTNESVGGGTINVAVVGTMTGTIDFGWEATQRTPTSKD